jgi:transposase
VFVSATIDDEERLRALASRAEDPDLAQRARIVLGCLEGHTNLEVARAEGVTNVTVGKWRRRFSAQGLAGLRDAPRSGGPRIIDDERVAEVVRLTLEVSPPDAGRWTTRSLGQRVGLSHATVGRIWREHQLRPASASQA